MSTLARGEKAFRSAIVLSLLAHLVLFLLILASPSLPKSPRKGTIHYVNLVSFPRRSGGGVGEEGPAVSGRETLQDLTTAQKLKDEASSSLRHPVEKPEKDEKQPDKKDVITQQERTLKDSTGRTGEGTGPTSRTGPSAGTGLRIGGLGEETGAGEEYESKIGLSRFPYTYYLQIIMDRVSANWFTSLVDPGLSGTFFATVYFKIARNGQVLDLKIDKSSGIRSLDMSTLRAIQSSSPFPPLPKEYEDEHLVIRLIFEHTK